MRVICLRAEDSGRSMHVANAMAEGFRRHGHSVTSLITLSGGAQADMIVAYGWRFQPVFEAYRAAGAHYIYVDMGFWNRKPDGAPRDGHHKVVLDAWCPTKHMQRGCPDDRFRAQNIEVHAPRPGRSIVIAGMSAKSAADHGYAPSQWETETIGQLQLLTSRPLVYRPKPSWKGAKSIAGSEFSTERKPIGEVLADAHALITHHSNAAVDAMAAGVPVYCVDGVGRLVSTVALENIESPQLPCEAVRRQFLADVAYLQWTPVEMRTGVCWDHMKAQLK